MDFSIRSHKKELLDLEDIPFDAIKKNMDELEFINQHLGGHRITLAGFKQLLNRDKRFRVCEIGCGGGDNLMVLYQWCRKKNIQASFMGIDINPHCISIAKTKYEHCHIDFYASDYRKFVFGRDKPHIIFSSLLCHHFTNDELTPMMRWMLQNAETGFFVNDLHRHRLAYDAISVLTRVFSKSYLVRNDAPLSVLRGFTRTEWETILHQAQIPDYSLTWRWAFRWLLVVRNSAVNRHDPEE